jgi:hypothetical protein
MPSFVSNERRLVLRILDYWEYLRGERRFPAPGDVDPAELTEDWRNCVLVDTTGAPDSWVFRHVGAEFSGLGPVAEAGIMWASCDKNSFLGLTTSYIPKVLDRCVPVSVSGEIDQGGSVIRYRSVLLPLSEDGDRVTAILGAANRGNEMGLDAVVADGGATALGTTDLGGD